ncbi:MAG: transposase [Pseudomonadota bacterium]
MSEIITLFQSIEQMLNKTTLKQLTTVVTAMLSMTGRVTMLGLSRWSDKGGSYRTIQRFYNTPVAWKRLNWHLVKQHIWDGQTELVLAADETVVTKAGKQTHGLDRFFSSIAKRVVPGLAFFAISVINPHKRMSSVISMTQLSRPHSTSRQSRPKPAQPAENKRGRPKGSKNKNRRDVDLPAHLAHIQTLLLEVMSVVGETVSVAYCVLDGAFGNNNAVQMVRRCDLHIVSKLRRNAALYLPFTGQQKKRGRRRQYGDRLDYANLPHSLCVSDTTVDGIRTRIYNTPCWHRRFADQLNVVVMVKLNLQTQQQAHIILFSSDLGLAWDKLVDFYKLRFQIEFNFRDAKQFWGLEDFMNIKELPVSNAANLAMFMVNVSQALLASSEDANRSVLDLKARYRGLWYARQLLNCLPDALDPLLINQFFAKASQLGAIHPSPT